MGLRIGAARDSSQRDLAIVDAGYTQTGDRRMYEPCVHATKVPDCVYTVILSATSLTAYLVRQNMCVIDEMH